jgi:glutamate synthase (NADPH) large chain
VWRMDRSRVNTELVDLAGVSEEDGPTLRGLVERHRLETGSPVAARLLDDWPRALSEFTAVIPRDYQRVVRVIRAAQEAGREIDETIMAELAALAAGQPVPNAPVSPAPHLAMLAVSDGGATSVSQGEVARA